MTKRIVVTALAVLMLLALAVPASASGSDTVNALEYCQSVLDTRDEEVPPGSGNTIERTAYYVLLTSPFGEEELAIQSLLGCVTTVRKGGNVVPVPYDALTIPAYNSQCRWLEDVGIVPGYPYEFYGNPNYHAESRVDCIYFLRSFHLGLLPPGPPA
jgi:hypothetical protein